MLYEVRPVHLGYLGSDVEKIEESNMVCGRFGVDVRVEIKYHNYEIVCVCYIPPSLRVAPEILSNGLASEQLTAHENPHTNEVQIHTEIHLMCA